MLRSGDRRFRNRFLFSGDCCSTSKFCPKAHESGAAAFPVPCVGSSPSSGNAEDLECGTSTRAQAHSGKYGLFTTGVHRDAPSVHHKKIPTPRNGRAQHETDEALQGLSLIRGAESERSTAKLIPYLEAWSAHCCADGVTYSFQQRIESGASDFGTLGDHPPGPTSARIVVPTSAGLLKIPSALAADSVSYSCPT